MRMMLLLCLTLAGCSHMPVKTVNLPTPVSCVDQRPERPALVSDDDLRAMNDYQLVLALWADRGARQDYERQLEVIVDGCAKAAN